MVSVRAEVLQGQGGRRHDGQKWGGIADQLPVRHQDVSPVQSVLLLRDGEAAVPLGRMTNAEGVEAWSNPRLRKTSVWRRGRSDNNGD